MNLFSLSALEETYEEQYGEKSILTLGSKGKTVLRDPFSTYVPCLNCCLPEFTARKLRSSVLKIQNKIFYRTVPLGHINNSE